MNAPVVTALDFDPFEGDFGTPGDKVLSDKMVKSRGKYACIHCLGAIVKGEVHRSRSEMADGDFMSARWCALCCTAMVAQLQADADGDDFDAFERRHHWQGRNRHAA